MKSRFFVITLSLFFCFLIGAEENNEFQHWVIKSTDRLNKTGKVIQTSVGPIQYVWKGDRKKPVVMSLHGAFGGWDQSLLIAEHLIDQGFSVLAVSRPGYLGSDVMFPPVITNESQATAMIEVLNALNISQVAALGFSAGAPVAFQMAKLFPERLYALVLESLGCQTDDIKFYTFLSEFIPYLILTDDTPMLDFEMYMLHRTAKDDFYSTANRILIMDTSLSYEKLKERIFVVTHNRSQTKFLKRLIRSFMPLSPRLDGIANDVFLASIGNWPIDPNFYQGIITPTIIIQGTQDTNGNMNTAEYVQSQVPISELHRIKGTGHFVWLGKYTKIWEKKLVDFLKPLAPARKK